MTTLRALLPVLLSWCAAIPAQQPLQVQNGIDALLADGCKALHNRKCGLITNHTGLTRDLRRTVDVLHARSGQDGFELRCLFSPEHGLHGQLDRSGIAHGTDEATGLKVWSLYGDTRKPLPEMLVGLDTLLFDIQDIGCRFYTYSATMTNAIDAAAAAGLRFVVLDRVNPLGGAFAGPVLQPGLEDFVGCHTIPLRHGLTLGELARMYIGEKGVKVDLQVIQVQGWTRDTTFDRTGLTWVNPSPNMRSLTEALLYPGIGVIEGTNISVGRGTDTPFEVVGAPFVDGPALAARLHQAKLPGVTFVPVRFTPGASKFKDKQCGGVQIAITDWRTFEPIGTGIALACALRDLCGGQWQHGKLQWLLRHQGVYDAFAAGQSPPELAALWQGELDVYRMRRKQFLLYP